MFSAPRSLPPKEVEALLSKLCVELGFCLGPKARSRLMQFPPETVEEFTDTVIALEGLDPVLVPGARRRQVVRLVQEAFERSEGDRQ